MKPLTFVLVLLVSACTQAGKQQAKLHYTELAPDRIIGSLGKPLGTIVKIQGTLISGDKLRLKAMSGKTLLEVTSVDGQRLREKIVLEFDIPMWAAIDKPEVGNKIRYLGYETGRMSGILYQAFKHVPAVASTDLHFRVYFVALKQN